MCDVVRSVWFALTLPVMGWVTCQMLPVPSLAHSCLDTLSGMAHAREAASRMHAHTPAALGAAFAAPSPASALATPDHLRAERHAPPPALRAAAASGSCHVLLKHGRPWRGSYSRLVRLTPTGLETLSTNTCVTNRWRWDEVLGARPVAGRPRLIQVHVTGSVPCVTPSPPKWGAGGKEGGEDEGGGGCLGAPWRALREAFKGMIQCVVFEAADEATAQNVLMQVRRAAERGMLVELDEVAEC